MPFPLIPLMIATAVGAFARMKMKEPMRGEVAPAPGPQFLLPPVAPAMAAVVAPTPAAVATAPTPAAVVAPAAILPEHPFRGLLGPERFAAYKAWETSNVRPQQLEAIHAQLRSWVAAGNTIDARHVCLALRPVLSA